MKQEYEASKVIKEYETPKIITYSEKEILEMIGPANTCGSSFYDHYHGHSHGHGHGHGHNW